MTKWNRLGSIYLVKLIKGSREKLSRSCGFDQRFLWELSKLMISRGWRQGELPPLSPPPLPPSLPPFPSFPLCLPCFLSSSFFPSLCSFVHYLSFRLYRPFWLVTRSPATGLLLKSVSYVLCFQRFQEWRSSWVVKASPNTHSDFEWSE